MANSPDFQQIFNASPNAYIIMSRELLLVDMNEAFCQATGHDRSDLGKHLFEAFPVDPAGRGSNAKALAASLANVIRLGQAETFQALPYELQRETPSGVVFEPRFWSVINAPMFDASGDVEFILGHITDITQFQEIKKSLRAVEHERDALIAGQHCANSPNERFAVVSDVQREINAQNVHLNRLFEQAPAAISVTRGKNHVYELANSTYLDLVGKTDLVGRPVREMFPEVEGQGYFELLDNVYATGASFIGRSQPVVINRGHGGSPETLYVDFIYQPIFDAQGSVSGIFTLGIDVTGQKLAQDQVLHHQNELEALVEARTRLLETTTAALNHSQKLEAVGKLTGGVAHDFNNVLQIIGGNLHLLRDAYSANQVASSRLELALEAVGRGAKLSSQLLAFARRQPLQPVVVNLARLVRDMGSMLARALGESVDIETVVGGGLWNTFVDRNQLENVLLNLAINARDAMQGQGKLTIELGNSMLDDQYAMTAPEVQAGQYVMLAVSDTGSGMPSEVIERAFEPFFTTKPEGMGTGLGLSMAYGFVKQSGGHIRIYSELGHGSTIKIYLPRSLEAETEPPSRLKLPVVGGSETILVVEDDLKVQATVVDMLTELGYRVLKANDGQSALNVINSGIAIDLLFTDVVMPGPVRSPDLARQARKLLPNLEVLFTSGYTQNAIVHGGRLDPGVELLSKPYARDDLARKVRAMLARRQPSDERRQPDSATAPARRAIPKRRILLVEDNDDLRTITCEMLSVLGCEASAVASAESALEALTTASFEVVLTDIHLPGMSGTVLAQKIGELFPNIRVVFVSGDGRADGLGAHCTTLNKPYDLLMLKSVLERL